MATKFDPRRAEEPGQVYDYHDADGELVTIRADDKGVVRPKTDAQRRAADAFDLPVARKAQAEERDEEPPAKAADEKAAKAGEEQG